MGRTMVNSNDNDERIVDTMIDALKNLKQVQKQLREAEAIINAVRRDLHRGDDTLPVDTKSAETRR